VGRSCDIQHTNTRKYQTDTIFDKKISTLPGSKDGTFPLKVGHLVTLGPTRAVVLIPHFCMNLSLFDKKLQKFFQLAAAR